MAMTKKAKKVTIIVVASVMVAILLTLTGVLLWMFVFSKTEQPAIAQFNVEVKMNDNYYFGNLSYDTTGTKASFSILDMLQAKAEDIVVAANDVASYAADGTLTVNKTGAFPMTVGGVVKQITVVDGINVASLEEFAKTVKNGKAVVLHKDIALVKGGDTSFQLSASMYGNAHKILCEAVLGVPSDWFHIVFRIMGTNGTNVMIQDVQITGKALAEGADFKLEDLDTYGELIAAIGDGINIPTATIQNCVLENANRVLFANNANLDIKGCILRNAADSCFSIETNHNGPSIINMENNVIMNSLVAGVQLWGYGGGVTDADIVTLNIKGFLDIYNWKERADTQIVPRSESSSGLVNPIIKSELKSSANDQYFYSYQGKEYVHIGVLIMATGGLKENKAVVTGAGYDGAAAADGTVTGYSARTFPLPPIAAAFINTCKILGFTGNAPYLKPDAKFSDNKDIYTELREGRKAA